MRQSLTGDAAAAAEEQNEQDGDGCGHSGVAQAGLHDAGDISTLGQCRADGCVGNGGQIITEGTAADDGTGQNQGIGTQQAAGGIQDGDTGDGSAQAGTGGRGERGAGDERDQNEQHTVSAHVIGDPHNALYQAGGTQRGGKNTGKDPAQHGNGGQLLGNALRDGIAIANLILSQEEGNHQTNDAADPHGALRHSIQHHGHDDHAQENDERQERYPSTRIEFQFLSFSLHFKFHCFFSFSRNSIVGKGGCVFRASPLSVSRIKACPRLA